MLTLDQIQKFLKNLEMPMKKTTTGGFWSDEWNSSVSAINKLREEAGAAVTAVLTQDPKQAVIAKLRSRREAEFQGPEETENDMDWQLEVQTLQKENLLELNRLINDIIFSLLRINRRWVGLERGLYQMTGSHLSSLNGNYQKLLKQHFLLWTQARNANVRVVAAYMYYFLSGSQLNRLYNLCYEGLNEMPLRFFQRDYKKAELKEIAGLLSSARDLIENHVKSGVSENVDSSLRETVEIKYVVVANKIRADLLSPKELKELYQIFTSITEKLNSLLREGFKLVPFFHSVLQTHLDMLLANFAEISTANQVLETTMTAHELRLAQHRAEPLPIAPAAARPPLSAVPATAAGARTAGLLQLVNAPDLNDAQLGARVRTLFAQQSSAPPYAPAANAPTAETLVAKPR